MSKDAELVNILYQVIIATLSASVQKSPDKAVADAFMADGLVACIKGCATIVACLEGQDREDAIECLNSVDWENEAAGIEAAILAKFASRRRH